MGDITICSVSIQRAIKYLVNADLFNIEAGVYEIQERDVYAKIMNIKTASKKDKKSEDHRKYIDVQYLVSGKEKMGFAGINSKISLLMITARKKMCFFIKNVKGSLNLP